MKVGEIITIKLVVEPEGESGCRRKNGLWCYYLNDEGACWRTGEYDCKGIVFAEIDESIPNQCDMKSEDVIQ